LRRLVEVTLAQDELLELIRGFDQAQMRQLRDIAWAMNVEVEYGTDPDSDIVTDAFNSEMMARLQAHHGTNSQPLEGVGFEDAFRAALIQSGREVGAFESATNRFYDIQADGERFALKSTKAKGISRNSLHISKLCEAAWIQDSRTISMRRDKTFETIQNYTDVVDRLIQLRVLPSLTHWDYELVEVPISLFGGVFALAREAFQSEGPSLRIADERGPIMTIALDRSDAKITVRSIRKSRCLVHATWTLPKDLRVLARSTEVDED
jgi:hypothetical protein